MGLRFGAVKLPAVLLTVACLVGLSCGLARADVGPGQAAPSADLVGPPVLQNPGFECKVGYVTAGGYPKAGPTWLDGGPDFRHAPTGQRPDQVGQAAAMARVGRASGGRR